MKNLKTVAFMAVLSACCLHASAQESPSLVKEPNYNKPKLFIDLPDKTPVRLTDMESLLNLPVGAKVNTLIAKGFPLTGTVVSKSSETDTSVKSVVIKSSNRQGATLTFTRIKANDGTFTYTGRMLSRDNADALEIVNEGEMLVIRKKGFHDLLSE